MNTRDYRKETFPVDDKTEIGLLRYAMEDIKIMVSPVIKQDGRQKIFVSFIDYNDKREAEAVIPGCIFIKNVGFSDEEIDVFKEYLTKEQTEILEKAKAINPLAEFFARKK